MEVSYTNPLTSDVMTDSIDESDLIVYHGTTESQIAKLKKKGLDSRESVDYFGGLTGRAFNCCLVYEKSNAEEYARWLGEQRNEPAYVVEFNVPFQFVYSRRSFLSLPPTRGVLLVLLSRLHIPSEFIKSIEKLA